MKGDDLLKRCRLLSAIVALITGVLLFLTGCGSRPAENILQNTEPAVQTLKLSGAGASFPYPLYSKWIEQYKQVKQDVKIDYQSIGSSGGIKGITEHTLDFAGSDVPMSDEEISKAQGLIINLPVTLGAVVIAYNLPGKPSLKMDAEVIGDIFMGKIKNWNDSRLNSLNPGINLPDKKIEVIHRSDGSGSTYVFTDYLSSANSSWSNGPGKGKLIEWPVGTGAKGNEGIVGQVAQIEGAIGYMEMAYAIKNNLPYAKVKNPAGNYIEPTVATTTAAAAGAAASIPPDLRVSIVNAPGADAYPIASFSYLLIYQQQKNPAKGKALSDFLLWATHEGQQYSAGLFYAPLPKNIVTLVDNKIKGLTF